MNVKPLRQVQAYLKNNPYALDMLEWLNDCGTVGCVAGWLCKFNDPKLNTDDLTVIDDYDFESKARDILDLPENISDILFYSAFWGRLDCDIRSRWNDALNYGSAIERASITSEYIDKFIEKYKDATADDIKDDLYSPYDEFES